METPTRVSVKQQGLIRVPKKVGTVSLFNGLLTFVVTDEWPGKFPNKWTQFWMKVFLAGKWIPYDDSK